MKTFMQIAMECDMTYNKIRDVVRSQNIVAEKINYKMCLNKEQEDLVHRILYFEGKITEITLESKMNKL